MNPSAEDKDQTQKIHPIKPETFLDIRPRISQNSSRPVRVFSYNPGRKIKLHSSKPINSEAVSARDHSQPALMNRNFPAQPQTARSSRPFTAHNSNNQRVSSTRSKDRKRFKINLPEEQKQALFGPMVKKLYTPLNLRGSVLTTRLFAEPLATERPITGIQNYMLGKEIGKGAYAVVRYAIHKASNRKVAIKIYDKTKFQDSSRLRNAHREIQILNKLNHSNILKMYEAIETDEFLYLILELINGLSLNDYVKKHPERKLSESDACRIFYQIILALEYCHANDVSHRDIKFDNVLLDHCNNVKIIDFGFSTCMPKDQRTKTFCGTPSYMAPEIILKSEYLGPPVDIWACGVVLFGMLCGYFPFKSHSDKECYKKILSGLVYIPSFVSSEPKELIEKILVANPDQRLTAKEILSNPWFKKLGNLSLNSEVSHYTTNAETEFTQGDSAISYLVKII